MFFHTQTHKTKQKNEKEKEPLFLFFSHTNQILYGLFYVKEDRDFCLG